MPIKQRIEDIGRIAEMLNILCEHEVFEWKGNVRNKDAEEWFFTLAKERQEELIHQLAYHIDFISEKLHEMYQIARYGDDEQSE